jgi:hypothetical protein
MSIWSGVSLLRPTSYGVSVATDYQGRVVGLADHYADQQPELIVSLPTRGVTTIYAQVGDSFAYLCLAGLAILTAGASTRRHPVRDPLTGHGRSIALRRAPEFSSGFETCAPREIDALRS